MGIYSSGDIYGIKMYLIYDDVDILYEIRMDTIMSDEKKKEAKLFYNELSEYERTKVRFEIYKEFCSTYSDSDEVYMMWESITLNYFLRNFSI
jgi:hypothetical protein